MARYRIGNDLTILWKVYDREGKALFLNDKEVHLFYTCERGRFEADINIQEDNIVVWNFYGGLQKTLGEYSLTLEIFQSEGMRSIKKDVCGAFVFVAKDCEADVKDTTVSLNGEVVAHQEIIKTNLDVCRVSPVIPYVVRDENGIGYWYVDGVNTGDRSTGETAYEYAVSKGYQGTEEEFASILALVPNKANKKGRYPEMSVGFADNLVGRGESIPAEFTFRATGGKSIKDGVATIKELQGNAVVWNNIIKPFADAEEKPLAGDITYLDNGIRLTNWLEYNAFRFNVGLSRRNGHKILLLLDYINDVSSQMLYVEFAGWDTQYFYSSSIDFFYTVDIDESNDFKDYISIFIVEPARGPVDLTNMCIVDLTQMFGEGNEPTTIEDFNARSPIGINRYAYNEGEVIPFRGNAVVSVGDNAWDEQWREGFYSSGEYHHQSGQICSANPIKVLPDAEYYLNKAAPSFVSYYDDKMRYIDEEMLFDYSPVFRTPSNCQYIQFNMEPPYGGVYNHDIIIRLEHTGWMTDIGIGYEPYWADTLQIDSRIKDAFPNGMMPWDKVYNKDGKGYIVKGTGVVDLGSLDWGLSGDTFYAEDNKFFAYQKMYCSRYTNKQGYDTSGNMYAVSEILRLFDSSYTDAAALKASLQGVMLYYELAEPTIETFDTPFNFNYRVADFGTEELLSEQPSAPFRGRTIYQFNAVDQIRENYNEIEKIKAALAKAGITIDL